MSHVFISYSKKNKEYAYQVADFLIEHGFTVWIDKIGIEYGVNWWDAIVKGVSECGAFLVIMTPESKASRWVQLELFLALEKKPMLPVLLNGANWEIFALTQYADVTGGLMPNDDFLQRLALYVTPQKRKGKNASQLTPESHVPSAPQEQNAGFDMDEAIAEFRQVYLAKHWSSALDVLGRIRASGEDPGIFDPDEFERRVKAQIETEARQREQSQFEAERAKQYKRLVTVAELGESDVLSAAWQKFTAQFPDYDPQELQQKLKPAHEVYAEVVRQIIGGPFEWCVIPSGPFLFGDDKQEMSLSTYWMAKYPITYRQFQYFLDDSNGFKNAEWWQGLAMPSDHRKAAGDQRWMIDTHPRENVSWYDSIAFCRWLSKRVVDAIGADSIRSSMRDASIASLPNYDPMRPATWPIRLPTEAEWEKVARGTDGRIYPWGDVYMAGYANIDETVNNVGPNYLEKTSPVGAYPQGASPYGCLDMAGNVWEWCLSEWTNPYQDQTPAQARLDNSNSRVLRGGSWSLNSNFARAAFRSNPDPNARNSSRGFRVCCLSAPI